MPKFRKKAKMAKSTVATHAFISVLVTGKEPIWNICSAASGGNASIISIYLSSRLSASEWRDRLYVMFKGSFDSAASLRMTPDAGVTLTFSYSLLFYYRLQSKLWLCPAKCLLLRRNGG